MGRRVEVFGTLSYRAAAPFPHQVSVSAIEVFPPESELPDWEDLQGRAPDATGALPSEAFVRELRDAWSSPLYYWDTCLFLAWLKDEERNLGEMDGVRESIDRCRRREVKIITSVLTSVEVLAARIPVGMDTHFAGLMKRISRVSVDTKVASLAHDLRNHYAQKGGKICRPRTRSISRPPSTTEPTSSTRSMKSAADKRWG